MISNLVLFKQNILLKCVFLLFFCINTSINAQKTYFKSYYKNGVLKEEGWIKNNKKTNFWKFYYKNGTLKKEGHFNNNLEEKYWHFYKKNKQPEKEGHYKKGTQYKWWLYYDDYGNINHKCQLKNNKKNGYCLMYKTKKLVSASKYKNGKTIKEWYDFSSFKKDNRLKDLE